MRWLLLASLSIWLVARFAGASAAWLGDPYPRSTSEGLVLYRSLLVERGGDLYSAVTPERFISAPHPPIYYWLAATPLPHTLPDPPGPTDASPVLTPGRLISLAAALVAALLLPVLIAFESRHASAGRLTWQAIAAGVVAGALFLSLPQSLVWATRFAGDMLALAFTAAGLLCVSAGTPEQKAEGLNWAKPKNRQKAESSPNTQHPTPNTGNSKLKTRNSKLLVLAAVFFSLAFFTSQTAIAGPIAAAIYLLLRDPKSGLKWCALMGLLIAVPLALLDLATGHWLYLKIFDYAALPFRQLTLTKQLQLGLWEDQWPLILIAAAYVLYKLAQLYRPSRAGAIDPPTHHQPPTTHHQPPTTHLLIPLFALTSFIILIPTGATIGAEHNQLLAPGLAVCACVGAFLAEALAGIKIGTRRIGPLAPLALLVVYALVTSSPSPWYSPDLRQLSAPELEQLRLITLNAKQNQGNIYLAENPGILALAGKETPYNDLFAITTLAAHGRWDDSTYRQMLRDKKFSLLLLSCDVVNAPDACRSELYSPGVLAAIRDGYNVLFRDIIYTYAPK